MFVRARCFVTVSILILAALLLVPTFATAVQIADVENAGEALVFYPTTEAQEFVLTVTGPCNFKYRQRSEEELVFQLDETTIDGAYTFELVAIPRIDPGILDILQSARESGDQGPVDELCRAEELPGDPAVQAAGFTVSQGQIIFDPEAVEEGGRSADQNGDTALSSTAGAAMGSDATELSSRYVISGDLTVYNSLCVGFDCLSSETYGADTIRLKENNLRIHFNDTSSGSFPTRDWRIVANDSASGGASKFSIDDVDGGRTPFTIEAAAPSHSLYVDDGGRIGLGTSTPVVDIHVKDGDTPTLRLEQDTSSGFAAQTWDVAGNETSFFVRDATNGSTLPFRIRPGASSNSLLIDTDDDVGIGAGTSPSASLHVRRSDGSAQVLVEETSGTAQGRVLFQIQNNGAARFDVVDTSASQTWRFANGGTSFSFIDVTGGGTKEFELFTNGNATLQGTLTELSDVNAKQDFESIDRQQVLAQVLELPVTTWSYKDDPSSVRHLGPTAQDFYAAFGLGGTDKGIAPRNLAAVALAAIQAVAEQKDAQIEELNARVEALEQLLAAASE